jgi:hypothetical protein
MVDAAETRAHLTELHRSWSWYQLERMVPLCRGKMSQISKGDAGRVRVTTAAAVESLWLDLCGPTDPDPAVWPTEALRDALRASGRSVKSLGVNMARNLTRRTVLTGCEADTWALRLGLLPEQVWCDWLAS